MSIAVELLSGSRISLLQILKLQSIMYKHFTYTMIQIKSSLTFLPWGKDILAEKIVHNTEG